MPLKIASDYNYLKVLFVTVGGVYGFRQADVSSIVEVLGYSAVGGYVGSLIDQVINLGLNDSGQWKMPGYQCAVYAAIGGFLATQIVTIPDFVVMGATVWLGALYM